MSAPVNYVLRPSKNMERKMICDAISRFARIAPLYRYRYVGFGGLTFQDFAIFHHRLGLKDMTSIERRPDGHRRFHFNKPYSCIRMQWGEAHDILPILDWTKRTIVWLDYERQPNIEMLQDIAFVAGTLMSGSVLMVTVPADPGEDSSDINAPAKRLKKLIDRVGTRRIPVGLTPDQLSKWGTATTYRRIITDGITTTLDDRNAALDLEDRVRYLQLFNFHYQDGCKMLTIGGALLNEDDAKLLGNSAFSDLPYIRSDKDPCQIVLPILTAKETKHLDTHLPQGKLKKIPSWLPEEDRMSYRDVYRYFPNYVEAEL